MTNQIQDPVYYFDDQLREYILQFMAVFAALKVKIGKLDDREASLIPVHLTYGPKDRVAAWIRSEQTQNKPLRLPAMSAYMSAIELAPDRRKGVNVTRRKSYMPSGGVFPDDIEVVEQLMPVPYTTTMDLSIYTSNRDEHHQILEQILMFFDPVLQVQKTDDTFDWTKITTIELVGINLEENYPAGPDRRVIQSTLNFALPVYIAAPAKVKNNFIREIQMRVGLVSQINSGSHNIIAELDQLGFEYEKIFDLDDVEIPE